MAGNAESPVELTYLADTVVLLRYFEAKGAIHRAVSVVKKRTGPHEPTIREFHIDSTGLRMGEPLTGFQGVLGGRPRFVGDSESLLDRQES